MLNEINDSISRSIDGKVIDDAKKHRRKTKTDQSLAKAAAAAVSTAKTVGDTMAVAAAIIEEAAESALPTKKAAK